MDYQIRLKSRIKNVAETPYDHPPKTVNVPINLIEQCFSNNPSIAESSLTDLFNYLCLQCSDDEIENFCQSFPYDLFLSNLMSTPEGKLKQTGLLIFSECSYSDYFPAKTYATNTQILSFFCSLLESPIKDEVTSSLQVLSQIMLACPPVCQFLVENQGIHSILELIEATPQFSRMLAILTEVHPQSLIQTLSLIPYCLETRNQDTISFALIAMNEAIKKVPECSNLVISIVAQYANIIFSFDIEKIDESTPYSNEIVLSDNKDKSSLYDEENIQFALKIISLVPNAPISLMTYVYHTLLHSSLSDTILLCNYVFRRQKNTWRGNDFTDDMLCLILQGMMENQPFEIKKSLFLTIMVYYRWESEINITLTNTLIQFLEDEDMKPGCLLLLCHLTEYFLAKKPNEKEKPKADEQSLSNLYDLLKSSAFPALEKIVNNPDETDENAAIAQKMLDIFPAE